MENEYSKVKVNNEMDFCSVTEEKTKVILEKAFMKANISYFLRWEYPNFFEKFFGGGKPTIVFCINATYMDKAEEVINSLGKIDGEIKMLQAKSKNKIGF